MYIQRIAKTARLRNVTGSNEARNNIARNLYQNTVQMVDELFESKQRNDKPVIITKKELAKIIKKIFPKMDIKIKNTQSAALAYQPEKISSYTLKLNFEKEESKNKKSFLNIFKKDNFFIKRTDYDRLGSLFHEITHLSLLAGNPKYAAKLTTNNKHWDFYRKFLYSNELEKSSLSFYKDALIKDTNLRNDFTKGIIEERLKNSSPLERIRLLQNWRSGLKGEVAAYSESVANETKYYALALSPNFAGTAKQFMLLKGERINTAIELQKRDLLDSHYNFINKIKIIEDIIKEEMLAAGHDVTRFQQK